MADAGYFEQITTSAGSLEGSSATGSVATPSSAAGSFATGGAVGSLAVDARSLNLYQGGSGLARVFEFDTVVDRTPPVFATGEVDLMIGGTQFSVSAGRTLFVGSTADNSEADVAVPVPALTITELYAYASSAPGTGETYTLTVRKNGVDTSLAATISGTSSSANDSASISFSAGDRFSVSVVTSSGAATASISFSVKRQFAS